MKRLRALCHALVASAALAPSSFASPLVVYDRGDLPTRESKSGIVLPQALDRAMQAYAVDTAGSGNNDSVLGLVLSAPEMFGLSKVEPAAATQYLSGLLASDPDAEIVLLSNGTVAREQYRFLPEQGESLDTNWVFRIILPNSLNVLIWAVVPDDPTRKPYAYAVE